MLTERLFWRESELPGMDTERAGPPRRLSRRRGICAVAAVAAALAVTSCGVSADGGSAGPGTPAPSAPAAPGAAAGPPSNSPASRSLALPSPFPAIAPVARPAGWTREVSRHWVGYTFPTGNVTGVRAEWTEPTVSGRSGTQEFVWLGIGGWDQTNSNIIQAGTFAYFPGGGQTNEGVWYQLVPVDQKAIFPVVGVAPGDHIYASVIQLPGGKWQMTVADVSLPSSFSITLNFKSPGAYPSFVVEDPDSGQLGDAGPFYPFPRWRSVVFADLQVRVGRVWVAAASLPAIRIDMVRDGRVLATTDPLSRGSSFSARQS
jgi:hypothetical protein